MIPIRWEHVVASLFLVRPSGEMRRPRRYRTPGFRASESLEPRCLLSADHSPFTIGYDAAGNEWSALEAADPAEEATTIAGGTNTGGSSPFALSQTFELHSNPNASHTIYLDFDGHVTSGTYWNSSFNGGAEFTTPAYNIDGTNGFSNTELTNIQLIWQRVAEDYIGFNVDVTTAAPANSGDLIKSGSSDTRWGVRQRR